MTKAVLWDLDGTLVDSLDLHWRAWVEIAAAEGLALTHAQFVATLGKRNDEIVAGWFGDRFDADGCARLGHIKEARFRDLVAQHGLLPLPGAAEWVARLRADGWRQAIATSAPRANLEAMLSALGLTGRFDAEVAAEDVVNGKPHPEVFLTAAARVGATPERAVVVEDAVNGLLAGRAAGMKTIAVHPTPLPGADLAVASLTNLAPDAFDALIRR